MSNTPKQPAPRECECIRNCGDIFYDASALTALEQECAKIHQEAMDYSANCAVLQAQLAAAKAEIEALQKMLRHYER